MILFRKVNASSFPDSLRCEASGLERLRQALAGIDTRLAVPQVISVSDVELVLPRIDTRRATPALMSALGEGLARLHQQRAPRYGLDHDNYIGLAPQRNGWSEDWGRFFRDHRLGFQISRIRNLQVRREFHSVLEENGAWLVEFLNQNTDFPSLLHGDLWAGNVLFDGECVWLIDPAIYYGDREADLAMTEFFGGFSADFLVAYDRVLPRSSDYPIKRDIYNLYHALNHYNLFGKSYLARCRSLLQGLRSPLY